MGIGFQGSQDQGVDPSLDAILASQSLHVILVVTIASWGTTRLKDLKLKQHFLLEKGWGLSRDIKLGFTGHFLYLLLLAFTIL